MRLALAVACLAFGGSISAQDRDCQTRVEATGSFESRVEEAHALQRGGCRPEAHDLSRRLLDRAERDYGASSVEAAEALDLLAETSYWLGKRDAEAVDQARQALDIRLGRPGDPLALAVSHRNLGALLASQLDDADSLAEALDHYEKARRLWQEEAGSESREIADLLVWIAELVDDWGETGRERVVRLPWVTEILDPQTAPGRATREVLGDFAGGSDDGSRLAARLKTDLALVIAARGVALTKGRISGPEGSAYAASLNMLGNLLNRRQLYDEALMVFDACLEVRRSVFPPGHPQIARAYHNRGEARMLVGDLEGARPDLEEAYRLRLAAAGDRFPGVVATSLRLLGKLLVFTGDLQGAVRRFKDALPRLLATFGDAHWRYAAGLISLAETFEELGEARQAERYYREALAALERSVSAQEARKAAVQAQLGTLLVETGDSVAGERLLSAARRTQEALPAPPIEDYARTLLGLAKSAEKDHDLEGALPLYRSAVDVLESYQGIHPELIETLLTVAEAELGLERRAAAAATSERVDALLHRLGPTAYAARARYLLLRARLLADTDSGEAVAAAAKAGELFARHLAGAFRVLPPDTALRFRLRHYESLEIGLGLLADMPEAPKRVELVWRAVAQNRGLLAEELEQRYGWARQDGDPELREALANLDDARQHLARIQVRTGRAATLDERRVLLRYADARVRATERALAEKTSGARFEQLAMLPDLSALLKSLPEDATLVAYVRYGSSELGGGQARYGAFVGRRGAPPAFVELGVAEEIDGEVSAWRSALFEVQGDWDRAEDVLRQRGTSLRRLIWDPVQQLAGDSRRFFLVLDGSLFLVAFAALPDETGYLAEGGSTFHRLVSERDLLRSRELPRRPRHLLAVGGPDFEAGFQVAAHDVVQRPPNVSLIDRLRDRFLRDPCLGRGSLYFFPLKDAREEAREVADIFRQGRPDGGPSPQVTELSDGAATETAFKELAPGHSVLHVATHGFFDLHCNESATARGLGNRLLGAPRSAPLVSGLAFAGANNLAGDLETANDGILTGPEIASLDLSGVEWVVLSACETAIGQVAAGEGVLGLARSFRVAGVETLILSLWPVEDSATRDWMTELYRARFRDSHATAEALRQASLEILDRRREAGETTHPYFWAAFVAMGGTGEEERNLERR